MPWGGGGAVPDPEKFSEPRSGEENFLAFQGVPQKVFKIKGLRLAKNAFPEISTWKN